MTSTRNRAAVLLHIAAFSFAAFAPGHADAQLEVTIRYIDVKCSIGLTEPKNPQGVKQGKECGKRPSKCDSSKTVYGKCVGHTCTFDELEKCDKALKGVQSMPPPLKPGSGATELPGIVVTTPRLPSGPVTPGVSGGIDDAFSEPAYPIFGEGWGGDAVSGASWASSLFGMFSGLFGGSPSGGGASYPQYSPNDYPAQANYPPRFMRPEYAYEGGMPMQPRDMYPFFSVPTSFDFNDASLELDASAIFDEGYEPDFGQDEKFTYVPARAEAAWTPPSETDIDAFLPGPVEAPSRVLALDDAPVSAPADVPMPMPPPAQPLVPIATPPRASAPAEPVMEMPQVLSRVTPERFLSSFISGAFDILPSPLDALPALISEILAPPPLSVELAQDSGETVDRILGSNAGNQERLNDAQTRSPSAGTLRVEAEQRSIGATIIRGFSRIFGWLRNLLFFL